MRSCRSRGRLVRRASTPSFRAIDGGGLEPLNRDRLVPGSPMDLHDLFNSAALTGFVGGSGSGRRAGSPVLARRSVEEDVKFENLLELRGYGRSRMHPHFDPPKGPSCTDEDEAHSHKDSIEERIERGHDNW